MFQKDDLKEFTLFDPQKDTESKIPNMPGNYAILLRNGSQLPEVGIKYTPSIVAYQGEKYEVIYVGISTKGIQKRDYKDHFNHNNSGGSTLRCSIGSLMGLTKTYRSKGEEGKTNPKIKFIDDDEETLSKWMNENLLLLFKVNPTPGNLETEMISVLNPPLNLQNNGNFVNKSYRDLLSKLRNDRSDLK